MLISDSYAVSGMPNYSESREIKLSVNSVVRSCLLSQMMLNDCGSSLVSQRRVIESLFPTSRITFAKFAIESPSVTGLSTLYTAKPLLSSFNYTRATCELSIAWRLIPLLETSRFTSVTSSLMAVPVLY